MIIPACPSWVCKLPAIPLSGVPPEGFASGSSPDFPRPNKVLANRLTLLQAVRNQIPWGVGFE
jgi:hypothetical protein